MSKEQEEHLGKAAAAAVPVSNEDIAQALAKGLDVVLSGYWREVLAGRVLHALEAKDREHEKRLAAEQELNAAQNRNLMTATRERDKLRAAVERLKTLLAEGAPQPQQTKFAIVLSIGEEAVLGRFIVNYLRPYAVPEGKDKEVRRALENFYRGSKIVIATKQVILENPFDLFEADFRSPMDALKLPQLEGSAISPPPGRPLTNAEQMPDMREKCHDFENTAQGMFCVSCGMSWSYYEAHGRPFCEGSRKPAPQTEHDSKSTIAAKEDREKWILSERLPKAPQAEPSAESRERADTLIEVWTAHLPRSLREQLYDSAKYSLLERIATAIEEARREGFDAIGTTKLILKVHDLEKRAQRVESTKREMESTFLFGAKVMNQIMIPRASQYRAEEDAIAALTRWMAEWEHAEAERDDLAKRLKEAELWRDDFKAEAKKAYALVAAAEAERDRLRAELSDERATRTHIGQCLSQLQAEHGDLQEACGRLRAQNAELREQVSRSQWAAKVADNEKQGRVAAEKKLRVAREALDYIRCQLTIHNTFLALKETAANALQTIDAPTAAEGEAR